MLRILPGILALAVMTAAATSPTSSIVGTRIPSFTIEDQYERGWRSTEFKGRTTVFVLSDRSGYAYSPNWTRILVARFKQAPVRFVPVADVQSVPGFLKGLIRSKFQEEFRYSVLLDWDGILIKAFKMTEGVPNLVIVDKHGIIQHTTYGEGTPNQVEAFAHRLQQLLAAG